jgi:hypothetical protein
MTAQTDNQETRPTSTSIPTTDCTPINQSGDDNDNHRGNRADEGVRHTNSGDNGNHYGQANNSSDDCNSGNSGTNASNNNNSGTNGSNNNGGANQANSGTDTNDNCSTGNDHASTGSGGDDGGNDGGHLAALVTVDLDIGHSGIDLDIGLGDCGPLLAIDVDLNFGNDCSVA